MGKRRGSSRVNDSPERARRNRLQRQQGDLSRSWKPTRGSGKRLPDAMDNGQDSGQEVGK